MRWTVWALAIFAAYMGEAVFLVWLLGTRSPHSCSRGAGCLACPVPAAGCDERSESQSSLSRPRHGDSGLDTNVITRYFLVELFKYIVFTGVNRAGQVGVSGLANRDEG
jgi:hypothetical protein